MDGRMYRDNDKTEHFRSDDIRGRHGEVEVRYDDESRETIDEIVTTQIHLERMSRNAIWMSINGYHVWITTPRAQITITGSPEGCAPFVVKRGTAEPPDSIQDHRREAAEEGAEKLVAMLRASNAEFSVHHPEAPRTPERAYEKLRVELIDKLIRYAEPT